MSRSSVLEKQCRSVVAFRHAFEEYLEVLERQPDGVTGPYRWVPKPGQDRQAAELRQRVGELSWAAAKATTEAGVAVVDHPPPSSGESPAVVNAIGGWTSALEPPNSLEVKDVLDSCTRAVAILQVRAREASKTAEVRAFLGFMLAVAFGAGWFVHQPPDWELPDACVAALVHADLAFDSVVDVIHERASREGEARLYDAAFFEGIANEYPAEYRECLRSEPGRAGPEGRGLLFSPPYGKAIGPGYARKPDPRTGRRL